jgi:hypothetical protein
LKRLHLGYECALLGAHGSDSVLHRFANIGRGYRLGGVVTHQLLRACEGLASRFDCIHLLFTYFRTIIRNSHILNTAGRFSRLGVAMQKYFSYRVIFDRSRLHADTQTPTIIAGYPHGVLPIGHILQVLAQEVGKG